MFDDPDLNQTATQLKKLSSQDLGQEEIPYLSMEYHMDRIKYHASGYGVKAKVISADEMWKQLHPEFDLKKFREVMPLDQAKKKEFPRKLEAFVDRRGWLPMRMKKAGQGAVVDIEKVGPRVQGKPRKMSHRIVLGSKRLEELALA